MKEMSNKAIAVLVIFSIVFSVTGMVIALNKLNDFPAITGFASSQGTGTTNVTVSSTTFITMIDNFIDLGTMIPGETKDSVNVSDYFTIQNDGSVAINISVYDSSSLFSGTGCANTPNYCYQANCASNESGECFGTYQELQNNATSAYVVVGGLSQTDSVDSITIGVNASVPTDESAGAKTTSMTIVATAS